MRIDICFSKRLITTPKTREMALAVLVLALIIPTTLIFLVEFLYLRSSEKRKVANTLPPANLCVPLIGENLSFLKPHPATTLGEFIENRVTKYGKIFRSHILGSQTIVSGDAELNQFVLKNEMRLFAPGWPSVLEKLLGKDSMPFLVGDEHKVTRRIVVDFLHTDRRRKVFFQDAEALASLMINSWDEGSVISARDETTKFTLYVMVKSVLSMNPEDPANEKLLQEYNVFRKGFMSAPINVPGTAYWKASKARENIVKIVKQEMEERMEKKGDGGRNKDDFLGWLMENTDFSQDKITTLVPAMILGGHETTSKALASLIYFLEDCPKAVQELREEHLQALRSKKKAGENKLTWEDYKAMKFTRCVINEALRLSNVADFVLKKATEDVKFKDYVIPQGHKILVHLSSVHLDPSLYENPNTFNPWRWQCSSGITTTNNFLPFTIGPRSCVGQDLARLEMAVFLNHLLLKYDWELAEPDQPMKYPSLDFPKGLPIRVRPVSITI